MDKDLDGAMTILYLFEFSSFDMMARNGWMGFEYGQELIQYHENYYVTRDVLPLLESENC